MDELYQDIILDSAQTTHNRGELSGDSSATHEFVSNPLCGDTVDLWMRFENGKCARACFQGEGCTISQAAASILVDELAGKSPAVLQAFIADYQAFLGGTLAPEKRAALGPLLAFEGVKKFPMRMRCAMLGFEALRRLGHGALQVLQV